MPQGGVSGAWSGRLSGGGPNVQRYAQSMDEAEIGDLVKVVTAGPEIDGIVFELPSDAKAVVAMVDRERGTVLRTVSRDALREREDEGPNDHALRLLIRRTPAGGGKGGPGGGAGTGPGRAGFQRAATHRTTGR